MTSDRGTGAEIVLRALVDQGVDVVFGYPGGAVLPIYDEFFKQNDVRHILVRHEQAAVHAAEGYARSTGRPGVVLVTSGPGATNAVTGLADALMDSIPLVCLTGQVATGMIGNDAFQEADTIGITRPVTKHNYLVKDVDDIARVIHEAFYVATTGRPGPVVIDLPKDIQICEGGYVGPANIRHRSYKPRVEGDRNRIAEAVELMAGARRPIFYTGGGVINSGPRASELLRKLAQITGFPVTSTLMGLGAFPASNRQFLGMLGMHGTYEANNAMHDCDVMICIGARFDDRVTGRIDKFSPNSKKIHVDIDRSSVNKSISVDISIIGDAANVLEAMIGMWTAQDRKANEPALSEWWAQIDMWRARDCLAFQQDDDVIMPQFAIQRLCALSRDRETFITTEVGQHQMWAAQHFGFDAPNRLMTSGGLGTMGYGLPAAVGVQVAHPDALVIDIAGEASVQMNIQEMGTAAQYGLPIKIFILNNEYMGMVRQWQELTYGGRYAESYSAALPDFCKLAESYGALGLRAERPDELDGVIREMIDADRAVIVDCRVSKLENCFPMVPAGAAHNQMLLGPGDIVGGLTDKGSAVV
ncbi:MAG: acetolactate synthase 3 large subunit [Sphingomonadales bacterium]